MSISPQHQNLYSLDTLIIVDQRYIAPILDIEFSPEQCNNDIGTDLTGKRVGKDYFTL